MNRFQLNGKLRAVLLAGMALGLLSLLLTFFIGDDEFHSRFWSNFLHNSTFFTGLSLMALFFLSASITAWAGWYVLFKRLWESFSIFLIVGIILMTIIGLGNYFHWHHLYHWADETAVAQDPILTGKAGFLNKGWYLIGGLIIMAIWIFFRQRIRALSLLEEKASDPTDFKYHRRIRVYAAAFLPIVGFSSAAMIWLWLMSLDAHWYSTLFAWYTAASWFVAVVALFIIILIYLKNLGYYQRVTQEHIHDLGKFLFAFSIFWTYLWFSQYMLIWYANIGEETTYFKTRMDDYPVLFYGNLLINFVVPFLGLMANNWKRQRTWLVIIATIVFLGHWIDNFLMVKPGVLHTAQEALAHVDGHAAQAAHHIPAGFGFPGLLEIGTLIGFLAFFLYMVFQSLGKANLVSEADPYLEESIHHHV
jgi:hypothetical protein